jgi:ABC-type phosphate transport system substrate-binding protein
MKMAELAGVTVGNYFLLECLGREGMVESYRARPTTQGGFDVVLRLFRPPFPDPTAFQEHFASEVEKVWHCHHEHIQPLLEFGSGEDLLFVVTEFPKGKTLEQVLEHGENEELFTSIPQIVRSIMQVCAALHFAHTQHIVHGNIQPSSLLMQPDEKILLTNFSMKRSYQGGEPLVAQIEEGNAAYIAPEQVVGMLTPASDIYAVGVLLYRLLTGRLPYDGESAGEIALKHANEAIPSLRQLRPDLSEAVELVVRVALAKSPEARFPSADALVKALLAALASESPPIVTVTPQRRIEVHSRRRTPFTWSRALPLIAILLVLLGLVGTLNFFATLPLHLQDIPGLPFHADNQGSIVETKQGTMAGGIPTPTATSNGVTTSTPSPDGGNLVPPFHVSPTAGRSGAPIISGTVIPGVPLTHNVLCTSGTLKLDSSLNLQPLLQQVDDDYKNDCHGLTISLRGDGSRPSLNKLKHGRIDVAGSDLTANPERNLADHPIGAMLYALVVSPDVELKGLSSAEIQEIFNGQISNWVQVGGSNEAITVVLPPTGSSINAIFQSFVLQGVAENVNAMRIKKDSPTQVVQSVLQTPGAISYVPLEIAQETGMKILTIDGVAPGVQALQEGMYAFWSVEHLYTQGDGSAAFQAYEQFLNSDQEQQVLLGFDVVPMNMIDQNVIDSHGSGPEVMFGE